MRIHCAPNIIDQSAHKIHFHIRDLAFYDLPKQKHYTHHPHLIFIHVMQTFATHEMNESGIQ